MFMAMDMTMDFKIDIDMGYGPIYGHGTNTDGHRCKHGWPQMQALNLYM
jgi:hypothetical protein